MTAPTAALTVVGNLDCEARWHGAVLPRRVLEHISAAATLLRFLFDEPIELWTPAPVPAQRLGELGAPALIVRGGPLPRHGDAAWAAFRDGPAASRARDRYGVSAPPAVAVARRVNDRRFAAALADQLGVAPPGAAVIDSVAALRQHLRTGGAEASCTDEWICKAPLSAAGRDRVLGRGGAVEGELERAVCHLLRRFAALTFEPYLSRTLDLGVCAAVRADVIEQRPPHTLHTSGRGAFTGISTSPPELPAEQLALLQRTTAAVGAALRDAGYLGPFTVDAFVYRDRSGIERLRPLCEINARLSFGWIAAALRDTRGFAELHFSPPPPDATVLLAAAPGQLTAWAR